MIPLISIGAIVLLILIVVWSIYNRLVQANNIVDEAFSGIDIQLKKRYELIPNLVEAVKGYNAHEAHVLEKIAANRSGVGESVAETAQADQSITWALRNFRIQVEQYPELKANTQFLKLMDNLTTVENELSMARRYYNGTVRDLHNRIQVFPNVLFAKSFGFTQRAFYEIRDGEGERPEINLTDNQ